MNTRTIAAFAPLAALILSSASALAYVPTDRQDVDALRSQARAIVMGAIDLIQPYGDPTLNQQLQNFERDANEFFLATASLRIGHHGPGHHQPGDSNAPQLDNLFWNLESNWRQLRQSIGFTPVSPVITQIDSAMQITDDLMSPWTPVRRSINALTDNAAIAVREAVREKQFRDPRSDLRTQAQMEQVVRKLNELSRFAGTLQQLVSVRDPDSNRIRVQLGSLKQTYRQVSGMLTNLVRFGDETMEPVTRVGTLINDVEMFLGSQANQ